MVMCNVSQDELVACEYVCVPSFVNASLRVWAHELSVVWCAGMLFGHALCEQANDRKKIMFHK